MGKVISLKNVSKKYKNSNVDVNALDLVDLSVEHGSILSIVGYSGCGKSTLLKLIAGLIKQDSGEIHIRENSDMAVVFQESRLLSSKTVYGNLEIALHHIKSRELKREMILKTLKLLELTEYRDLFPCQLSGGMSQRVSFGRAICREPSLLLLDEPFSALDALLRRRMQEELVDIYLKKRMTTVFVTHDVTEAVLLGSRVIVMKEGSIIDDININLPYPRNSSNCEFLKYRDSLLNKIYTSRRF